jgi:superfamily II DNA or RNA helicase
MMKTGTAPLEDDLFSLAAPTEIAAAHEHIENEDAVCSLFRDRPLSYEPRFELRAEAYALRLAYTNNRILSLSNSRTRILAHQVESTHRIVNAHRTRFLLADEVGLGKTVEAGLVIKEFIYRHNYKRILIVCPASLLLQWQREMESKFNEKFTLVDRRALGGKAGKRGGGPANPWDAFTKAICSMDFIKGEGLRADLKKTRWDAVIIDEAHRLRRDSQKSTLAYNAAEILAENAESLLFLTATPFRGKIEELYYLVRLLDKNLLGPFQSFYNEFCTEGSDLTRLREKLSSVIIRRTKKEVGGFTKRYAATIRFELHPEERRLYDETTAYVIEEFNRSLATENRAVGFVMTVFQKLLDSSSFALLSALCNRRNNLENLLQRSEAAHRSIASQAAFDPEAMDADDPEDVEEIAGLADRKTAEEIREEIRTLERLVSIAASIRRNKKGEKLLSLLRKLRREGHGKFIIFTQFTTTQDYLARLLDDFRVQVFNGSMDRDRKEDAMNRFRESAEVLICTEAGGEGRNMQFCNILINYDLPWSPLKVEQRIGRVHRFGQQNDVYIYNFSTRDTVAERVLEVLTEKLRLFEESIGMPDVLLGRIEDELRLNTLFLEMTAGRRSRRAAMAEIDTKIEAARRSYEKLGELTVSRNLDFNYDEYYSITLKEREFSHRRIESFVNRLRDAEGSVSVHLGRKNERTRLYTLKSVPSGGGRRGTFDSRLALEDESLEFLAFGHPLVDMLFSRCMDDEFGGRTGIKAIRYRAPFTGLVFNYLVTFTASGVSRELIPVVIDPDGRLGDPELCELEREFIHQEGLRQGNTGFPAGDILRMQENAAMFFSKARERLSRKLARRVSERREALDLGVDPEIENINESGERRLRELREQLERQECQKKWFGKDMKSALARTRNEIAKTEMERELLLGQCRQRVRIRCSCELLGAGVLTALPAARTTASS